MNKSKLIKIFGLLGAIATGGGLIMAGGVIEGIGIIFAALSSSTAFSTEQ